MLSVSKSGEIKLTRGDTARLTVSITNETDGNTYELQEGDILTLSVKKSIDDAEATLKKEVTSSSTFHIEPKDTATLSFGKYIYDV